jgi:dolichol-phosphate mannosyltransferase
MNQEGINFELIIVDDGSTDNSFEVAKDLQSQNTNVRAYRLSRNYTSPYSQFAGYSLANGACVVAITDDLQKPLTVVVQMYRAWENGAKVVLSHRSSRSDGIFSDLFSRSYYKFMNRFSDISFPPGGSDSALIDKEVYQIINNKVGKNNTTPTIEVLRLGFKPVLIPYTRQPTEGKSRWTLRKKLKLAADTFFSSSSFPIKAITWLGFIIFILSIILSITILYLKIFSGSSLFGLPIPGWATIVVMISVFNGLILLCIGIVAQYIWRIYEDVRGKLPYVIMKDNDSQMDL